MIYRLKRLYQNSRFHLATSSHLPKTPISMDPGAGFGILSQVGHGDVGMYLVALRTFAYHHRPASVTIVADRLSNSERDTVRRHCPQVTFIEAGQVDTGGCPTGGCWERIVSIAGKCQEQYIVQLDADTVTLAPLEEVAACIRSNRSFTLGTNDGTQLVTGQETISAYAQRWPDSKDVQLEAERYMTQALRPDIRYVRGSAGFAGFGKGSFALKDLQDITNKLSAVIGREKWRAWGSEQVTSNIIVANSPDAAVLPISRYACYIPPLAEEEKVIFFHFIGSWRFRDRKYVRTAQQALQRMRA